MADAKLASREEIERVLSYVPQQAPFRFIDDITELSADRIVGNYTYKHDEFFYPGHFPGNPTTPGVILVETMAQFSVVALGLYNALLEGMELDSMLTLFTECEIEFAAVVPPGATVTVYGEKVFMRRKKLKATARVELADGTVAASGSLAGQGVVV